MSSDREEIVIQDEDEAKKTIIPLDPLAQLDKARKLFFSFIS